MKRLITGKLIAGIALSATFCLGKAMASQEEAALLGTTLTPLGAEMAANADGSIPAYTGGLQEPPPGFETGRHMVDPFATDQPLAIVTANNMSEHEAFLTDGQKALFKRYPETYRLNLFPTRRTAHVPEVIQEQARRNVARAKLVDNGNGVADYDQYYPFPVPANALEVLWNHFMRYRGGSIDREHSQIITQTNGSYHEVRLDEIAVYPDKVSDFDPETDANILVFFRQIITAPSRLTGSVLLVHDTVNQVEQGRNAWVYNAGQRRVRRAPQVAYDGPGTAADGLRTADNFDMFTGAPDRYDWELIGKEEIYIPYNNYKLAASDTRLDDVVQAGHINPDYLRFEKHRVWKVVASLKSGQRHIYAKRIFYFDEDTWQIAYIDQFDDRGQIWRISEGYHAQYYYADTPYLTGESVIDLLAGRYLTMGLISESDEPTVFGKTFSKTDFTPSAIRRLGVR